MGPPPGMGGRRGPRGFLTEEEKANKPKFTKELLKRILSYLAPYKLHFLLVFAALAISAVLGLLPSVITGKIVDAIVADSHNLAFDSTCSFGVCGYGNIADNRCA